MLLVDLQLQSRLHERMCAHVHFACDEACAGIHCCRQHVEALERVHRVRRVCGRMSDLRNAMYL